MPSPQDRLIVVLVRARNPANIGAVARAMHDLGYRHLRVVNEFPVPFAAAKSAVDASSVLAAATEPATVAEAVADCTLVLGTTALGERVLEHPVWTLEQAPDRLAETLAANPEARIALLFGSEKTGLSNDELSHCHALLTIPMNAPESSKHLSMNLGQAAAVCLYRLGQHSLPRTLPEPEPPAAGTDLERVTVMLGEALDRSGYARRHPANTRPEVLRRLVRRMHLNTTDAAVWTGILRQMLHALAADDNAERKGREGLAKDAEGTGHS